MTWCLSWWTPSGVGEVLVVGAFWAGVAGAGIWGWRHWRTTRTSPLTAQTDGDRHPAGTGTQDAPEDGARIGSTR